MSRLTICREEFIKFVNIVKSIKYQYVIVGPDNNDIAFVVDEDAAILTMVKINIVFPFKLVIDINVLKDVVKNISIYGSMEVEFEEYFISYILPDNTVEALPFMSNEYKGIRLSGHVLQMLDNITSIMANNSCNAIHIDDVSTIPGFIETLYGKTGDGVTVVNANGYMLSIYSTLLPVNKADTISITIYPDKDSIDSKSYLVLFTISKKKPKTEITVIVKYLDLH